MGSTPSRAEFETVLSDQVVESGKTIFLKCKVKTEGTPHRTWKKNNEILMCVEGKHIERTSGNIYTLYIQNAEPSDEGIYTLTVGSVSCSAMVYVSFEKPWREVKWETKNQKMIMDELQGFKITNEKVQELHFLVCGRVDAGKSSTINTIRSIFEGRQYVNCLAGFADTSQTTRYVKEEVTDATGKPLPFAFFDMMGMEYTRGVVIEDIINCINGYVKEGYEFSPSNPMTKENKHHNAHPSLSDRIHCLVFVVSADSVSQMEDKFLIKMQSVRKEASRLGIPQVVFLSKVDKACLLTMKNLQNVYKSKRIKEKMQACSNVLGVPLNLIFPIQTYHELTQMDNDINSLMLEALLNIVYFANDYVKKCK